jgi:hypothetical protein
MTAYVDAKRQARHTATSTRRNIQSREKRGLLWLLKLDPPAETEHRELAEKLGSFLASKDASLLHEIYHDDAQIWHNYDDKNMTVQEIVELVESVFSSFSELASENIWRSVTDKGFVQQHDIVGTHVNGGSLNVLAL